MLRFFAIDGLDVLHTREERKRHVCWLNASWRSGAEETYMRRG